jgi:hypothetical protein
MATVQATKGRVPAAPTKKAQPAPARASSEPLPVTDALIATRAYEIWQERGCPAGLDLDHWFEAERELREVHDE